MRSLLIPLGALLSLAPRAWCVNFAFEAVQLNETDVGNFTAIAFGDASTVNISSYAGPSCKPVPGDDIWPSDDDWAALNEVMDGRLLKPLPPAASCYLANYNAAKCEALDDAFGTRFYIDDPVTVLSAWPTGNTCPQTSSPRVGSCQQGGYPVYVLNATTVKGIQAAVNFARNNHVRLIIKNTGHDFEGRSCGTASLSVWTHWLKEFEFLANYTQGNYSGPAARVGAGLEAWELYAYMDKYNMTIVVPGGSTVGAYGGWTLGGGHSVLSSYHGMGADQVLSLQVVTADGRFITADPEQNTDLFYALRGGGPATYGIVTSMIVRAYPPLNVTASTVRFSSSSAGIDGDADTFWTAVGFFYWYGRYVVDEGGGAYSYTSSFGSGTDKRMSFSGDFDMPGKTPAEVFTFVQPFYDALTQLGLSVTNPRPTASTSWGGGQRGGGDAPSGGGRFASRLFPKQNWDNETIFDSTMAAIRYVVELGYEFHGIHLGPREEIAGWLGNNGLNPAFRNAYMHADIFDFGSMATPAQMNASHNALNAAVDHIRAATPGGGAYINEGDVQEPDWQQSFFGDKYARLLEVKNARDPWRLFWAPSTVGSEDWSMWTDDGMPTQNGWLCRTDALEAMFAQGPQVGGIALNKTGPP